MEEVIEGGPWLFQGQPIVLQRWEPGMVLRKHKHTQVPVWIRLRHLPVEFWTDDGLSTVASGVGRPLYQDTITRACTRLDFARVCVMLDISSTLPKHLIIMMPKEDAMKYRVNWRWSTNGCHQNATIKRTVQPPVSRPAVPKGADRTPPVAREDGAGVVANEAAHDEVIDKGKAVVVYNPFDVLLLTDDDAGIWNVRGLNRRDHQVAVKELVSEFRLQFLGLLETRVSAVNVSRIQTFLPHWSWFTDYNGSGNRIWLAWDDELLDVHVLDLDVQFIHCRVTIRCAHLTVLATVVYGANDTIADIQLAMTEFRDCILDTGLIHLSVQGERFSWHNCSEGDRSLWKRLDRLIVNDAWLGQWPSSHYQCLNARTSDHSPLVIRGDPVSHTVSTNMYAVTRKLRALKPVFRTLRKKKGDLSLNVKLAAEFLELQNWNRSCLKTNLVSRSMLKNLLPKGGHEKSIQEGVPDSD
ncbi:UNVERIFIED_CONTAM: hypothetical protein Scaly_2993900 [Sesamum calycinum]|uniref:DUF4283 domain-containing protein n=1 Tax=Sesamum calycinum TaxID=2727403 RepID=A0AAW2KDZ8_9LAMI